MANKKAIAVGVGAGLLALLFGMKAKADDGPVNPNDPDLPPPPPPDDDDTVDPGDFITPTPTTGRLYSIKSGDNPTKLMQGALIGEGQTATLAAIQCFNRSGWNLALYSKTVQPGTYGAITYQGKSYTVGSAFLPRNQAAGVTIYQRKLPTRSTRANGGKLPGMLGANTWGTIYIPSMSIVQGGALLCPNSDPFDASMLPPAEFLAALGTSAEQLREIFHANL